MLLWFSPSREAASTIHRDERQRTTATSGFLEDHATVRPATRPRPQRYVRSKRAEALAILYIRVKRQDVYRAPRGR